MRSGTALFLESMARVGDADLDAPTDLPGWTRRHLLAHVGFNARALQRLVRWARTGEPTPMYSTPEQRVAEIEEGAGWDGSRLRDRVTASAADLDDDLDKLDAAAWRAQVVTAQGRTVPADQIPWMRTREVTVHAVDLGTGAAFADLPADLCEALVEDVVARRTGLRRDPPVKLHSTSGRTWTVGDGPAPVITGTPAALARWLTGRGADDLTTGGPLPVLTPWL
jgi:maleylpyruvate isomerase